jgi:hypothetical protein
MSNATWACFDCRETVRRPDYTRQAVLCPSCGQSCRYLGRKICLPPKRQVKKWQELLSALQQHAIATRELKHKLRLQQMRKLRAEIARLEAKGPHVERAKQVRVLRRRLAAL